MPAPRPLQIDFEGKPVRVYRNLQIKGYWSVQYQGKVVAHLTTVHLINVAFQVSEAGRQRVVNSGQKNVHACAAGVFTQQHQPTATEHISYDPYAHGHFYKAQDKMPVYAAGAVLLSNSKAYASPSTLLF